MSLLLIIGALKEFLTKIIAKRIFHRQYGKSKASSKVRTHHQINHVGGNLVENHIEILRVPFIELLLEIATTMLIFRYVKHLTRQLAELNIRIPLSCECQ